MQCLPTKFFLALAVLLVSCGSQPSGPVVSAYIEAVQLKEKLASEQFASANYQEALVAYHAVYSQYLKVDSHTDMARLLTNKFQTALIIEDIQTAKLAQAELEALLLQSQDSRYQQRLILLKANLAMIEEQWPLAIALLQKMPSQASSDTALAARVSEAIAHVQLGDDVTPLLQQLAPLLVDKPALAARIQRLQATIALQNGMNSKALPLIHSAKKYYQSISFPPGVAECLVLEANLAHNNDNTALARQLEHSAKSIFRLLGNSHAITRHAL